MIPISPRLGSGADPRLTRDLTERGSAHNLLAQGRISAKAAMPNVPTTGLWATGDFVTNSNPVLVNTTDVIGYVVEGWKCISGGEPGTWVEYRMPAAPPPVTTLAPAPSSPPPPPGPPPSPPPPPPAPPPAVSQKIQAESMTMTGTVAPSTEVSGYEGTGHATWFTAASDSITATFTNVAAGTYRIDIRYFNYDPQVNAVSIDGGANTFPTFAKSTPNWAIHSINNVTFSAGTHTVKISKDWGYTYYDWIEIVPIGGSAINYPFGSRLDLTAGSYPYGIKPSHKTATEMDAAVKTNYDAWKANLLKKSISFTAHPKSIYGAVGITDGYHVQFTGTTYATVSEGIAYGMLITVVMAGYDPNARTYFDGLFRVARARCAYGWIDQGYPNGKYLMEWRLWASMDSAGGGFAAHDGDIDIAYALLMAHRQWGSTGAINYLQEALNTIAAMKQILFATTGEPRYTGPGQRAASRVSDYMIGHFRAFAAAASDTWWTTTAAARCLTLVQNIITGFSPTAKLVPDFIVDTDTASPIPSPGNILEGPWEGRYSGNSCRVPWRWGSDYVYSGDANWRTITRDIVSWIKSDCAGNVTNMAPEFNLDGTPFGTARYWNRGIGGPAMVGCATDAVHQQFMNDLWDRNVLDFSVNYYDAELQLLPMIVASGNWWRP